MIPWGDSAKSTASLNCNSMKILLCSFPAMILFLSVANGQTAMKEKGFVGKVRILAELPNPFEDGLHITGPRHRNFVVQEAERQSSRYFLLRLEYDSWRDDHPLGSKLLKGGAIWQVNGVEQSFCASSIRAMLAVNSPEPRRIKSIYASQIALPPYDQVLVCIVSEDLRQVQQK